MKGNFSRRIDDALTHYVGVLHQQGRVWLDSDWNEEVFERLLLQQHETLDIIGVCGVPAKNGGFRILPGRADSTPADFIISAGRAYVNGLVCQLNAHATYLSQPDLLDPPAVPLPAQGQLNALVYLEVWHRLITYLQDDTIREVALGGPDTTARIKTIAQVKIVPLPDSVTDLTCPNSVQFLPGSGRGTLTTLSSPPQVPPDLCKLPQPGTYTGRENRLYRVEVHDGGTVAGGTAFAPLLTANAAAAGSTTLTLASAVSRGDFEFLRHSRVSGTDSTSTIETLTVVDISADGTVLTVLEPLLASMPAQTSLQVQPARFVWSRDNASFAVAVTEVGSDRMTLTVSSLGRDQATALRKGDLVEITDDASDLGPARGHLTYLSADPDADGDSPTVTLQDPLPASFQIPGYTGSGSPPSPPPANDRHMVLRRWDGLGTANAGFDPIQTPDMDLGDGIHIQFGGIDLRPGDYWQFTARTDGSVESLTNAPPRGITRVRCPLAVVQWNVVPQGSPPSPPGPQFTMKVLHDCRVVFPPLAEPGIHVIGVYTKEGNAPLLNDTQVEFSRLVGGIDIDFDNYVAPPVLSRAVVYLTVEVPTPLFFGCPPARESFYLPIVIAGEIVVKGTVVFWRPRFQDVWLNLPWSSIPPEDPGLLARLTIKGDFVWARDNHSLYLDGDVFGVAASSVRQAVVAAPGGAAQTPQRVGGSTGAPATGAPLAIPVPSSERIRTGIVLPSGDGRKGGDFITWFWITGPQPQPLAFSSTPSQPTLRAEGLTEAIGDLIVTATGGSPTPTGQDLQIANVQIASPAPIASPPAGALQEDVVLRIDEPVSLNLAGFGIADPPAVAGVGGFGVDYKAGGAPNVFQAGPGPDNKTVVFASIPLDPPGNERSRGLRVSNVRLNASALAGAPSGGTLTTSVLRAGQTPVSMNSAVASALPAMAVFDVRNPKDNSAFPAPTFGFNALNQSTANSTTWTSQLNLHFSEGFASAFKTQVQECGYQNPALPGFGKATQGTRVRVTFSNVPAGIAIYVTLRDVSPGTTQAAGSNFLKASLTVTDPDGAGGFAQPGGLVQTASGPAFRVLVTRLKPEAPGTGWIVWEWVSADPTSLTVVEEVSFGVILVLVSPGLAQGKVGAVACLAPVPAASSSLAASAIPRFSGLQYALNPIFSISG